MTDDEAPDMTLSEFRDNVMKTAVYPRVRLLIGDSDNIGDAVDAPWLYPVLGLVGEAGELANQAKKIIRDDGGILTPGRAAKMADELGDVKWYIPPLSEALRSNLKKIARNLFTKLFGRFERGTIQGSGDNR